MKDADKFYHNAKDCIFLINTTKTLCKVLASPDNYNQSILSISIDVMRNYLTAWECCHSAKDIELFLVKYTVQPHMFYQHLRAEIKVADEVHKNIHFQFRSFLQTDVPMMISLSATLSSNLVFYDNLYGLIYPLKDRYVPDTIDKNADVVGIWYHTSLTPPAHCKNNKGMYSHVIYEKYIMKNPKRLETYLEMILDITYKIFVANYIENQVLLILAATTQMCDLIADALKTKFAEYNFSISPYYEKHDKSVLHSNNMIPSTPTSAGEGVDIKGLVKVLNTVAVNRKEPNIQHMGRLRKVLEIFPGVVPGYFYILSQEIPKHRYYNKERQASLAPYAKSMRMVQSHFRLP